MNTNMIGFRCFSKLFVLVLWTKVALAFERLKKNALQVGVLRSLKTTFSFFKLFYKRFSLNPSVIVIVYQMPNNRIHLLQLNSIT